MPAFAAVAGKIVEIDAIDEAVKPSRGWSPKG